MNDGVVVDARVVAVGPMQFMRRRERVNAGDDRHAVLRHERRPARVAFADDVVERDVLAVDAEDRRVEQIDAGPR